MFRKNRFFFQNVFCLRFFLPNLTIVGTFAGMGCYYLYFLIYIMNVENGKIKSIFCLSVSR